MPANINWLTLRSAGAVLDLARTPYVYGVDSINADPRRDRENAVHNHTRKFLPSWPANAVQKIKVTASLSGSAVINSLELECTQTGKQSQPAASGTQVWNIGELLDSWGGHYASSNVWSGGDDLPHPSATFYQNIDRGGNYDTIINDYAFVDGFWTNTGGSVTYANPTPTYSGLAMIWNGAPDPNGPNYFELGLMTMHADYSPTVFYSTDLLDSYSDTYINLIGTFRPRLSSDAGHGLKNYVTVPGGQPPAAALPLTPISFRHASTDLGIGMAYQYDTTCQWYYNAGACEDCWYKDRVVTVELTYKKAALTFSHYDDSTGGTQTDTNENSLGTWSTHSTVTQTLTLPSVPPFAGRQAINASFTVPTLAGHVVVLDDIRLVSVS